MNSAWGYIKEFGNQAVRGLANTGVQNRAFDAIITFYEEGIEEIERKLYEKPLPSSNLCLYFERFTL